MKLSGLVVKEMVRRKLGLVLSVLAAVTATAAYIGVNTISDSWEVALRKLTLEMGKNILIVPKDAVHDRIWAADFGQATMPEDFVEGIAATPMIVADHYIGKLQRRVTVEGMVVVLTGHRREIGAAGRQKERLGKKSEGFDIKAPDEAWLGYDVASDLKKDTGATITIEGQAFSVANVLPQSGTMEDLRISISLKKMQEMFDLKGRINAIDAIGCTCPLPGKLFTGISFVKRSLDTQVQKLAEQEGIAAPEVIMIRDKFEMRDKSLRAMAKVGVLVSFVLLSLCGLGIGFYMFHNVSDRRYEMAVLLALGYRPGWVIVALLAKVILVGVVGGIGGFLVGTAAAVAAWPTVVGMGVAQPMWHLWWQALVAAVGLCVTAAAVAVWGALRVDPAYLLRNQ